MLVSVFGIGEGLGLGDRHFKNPNTIYEELNADWCVVRVPEWV